MFGIGVFELLIIGVLVLGAIIALVVLIASGGKRDKDRDRD
jgi:hypothetical protein